VSRDDQSADQAAVEEILRLAATIFGRRGGVKTSPAKAEAVRANGTKGGRPRGPNYKPRNRPGKPKAE